MKGLISTWQIQKGLFSKQRSAIEKEYGQALQKLSQQFLTKRKFGEPPVIDGIDRAQNRGLIEVFKLILEHTEYIGEQRMQLADTLLAQISEVSKVVKKDKEHSFKKLQDVQQQMHTEVHTAIREVIKNKKAYHDLERLSSEARQRFSEAEAKMKKKELKFYESRTTLEKQYSKVSDRLKSCQKRSTVARNEYLLSIGSTNALLDHYFQDGLPTLMKVMDGNLYEKTRELYVLYADMELQACSAVSEKFLDLKHQSNLVSRDYVVQCYLKKFPIMSSISQYEFESFGQDKICAISKDHGAEIYLNKGARKIATDVMEQKTFVAEKSKQVKGLQSVSSAYLKNPEFGTANATHEAENKTDLLQEEIRQAEVTIIMYEKKLDLLRKANIDVDKWLQTTKTKDSQDKSSLRESKLLESDASLDPELLDISKDDRFDQLSMASVTSSLSPKFCVALYDYKARAADELDITTSEKLEVTEWDDGDGWCKGRNKYGKEGYFPQSYVSAMEESRPSTPHHLQPGATTNNNSMMLKALYEYSAVAEEELSFPEGAEIKLIRKDDNGIDDGWWEGEYMGRTGVFPSIVVEIIGSQLNENDSDGFTFSEVYESPPPLPPDTPSSPPPVIDYTQDDSMFQHGTQRQRQWQASIEDSFDEENSLEASIV
ncbi:F-BAR and double SH3 domains protein 2-like isoform X3 [Dysidea avara]|uniref:F-BAR and double SH3 domains protein 2-like isoform X3 n=1 Tax=Dysidea avara TaxID=196820 RepID=UPI00331CC60F